MIHVVPIPPLVVIGLGIFCGVVSAMNTGCLWRTLGVAGFIAAGAATMTLCGCDLIAFALLLLAVLRAGF